MIYMLNFIFQKCSLLSPRTAIFYIDFVSCKVVKFTYFNEFENKCLKTSYICKHVQSKTVLCLSMCMHYIFFFLTIALIELHILK